MIRQWEINEEIDKFRSAPSTSSAFGEFAVEHSLAVGTSFKGIFIRHDFLGIMGESGIHRNW